MGDFHAASYEDLSAGCHLTFRLCICLPLNLLKMHEYMDCQQKDSNHSTDQNIESFEAYDMANGRNQDWLQWGRMKNLRPWPLESPQLNFICAYYVLSIYIHSHQFSLITAKIEIVGITLNMKLSCLMQFLTVFVTLNRGNLLLQKFIFII